MTNVKVRGGSDTEGHRRYTGLGETPDGARDQELNGSAWRAGKVESELDLETMLGESW